MKTALSILAFAALSFMTFGAFANDYNRGQCPVEPVCTEGSGPLNETTFDDTAIVFLGDWTEFYGVLAYTSSMAVTAEGGIRYCGTRCPTAKVIITNAIIDGAPLNPPAVGSYVWMLPDNLAPGWHTFHVIGTVSGNLAIAYWVVSVRGIVYTVQPLPPCTDCGGE